ncbi:MAG: hypothetical protein VB108_07770 [Anaerolineaceae bacterium]|nr:hypothetical protein [Anaerolineaceae bacterium]
MSAEEYITCPHCGKENLIQATRCIYCKQDLDPVAESVSSSAAEAEDLSEMIGAMTEEKSAEPEEEHIFEPSEQPLQEIPAPAEVPNPPQAGHEEIPSWQARVRQRMQNEGNPRGLYNRESQESHSQKAQEEQRLDRPFDTWISVIHEDQAMENTQPDEKGGASEAAEIPVWLKRVRDLQLKPNENETQKPVGIEAWKAEWSEEDLERLKSGEFDEKTVLQPSLLDNMESENKALLLEDEPEKADVSSPDHPEGSEMGEDAGSDINHEMPADAKEAEEPVSEEPEHASGKSLQEAQAALLRDIVDSEEKPHYQKKLEPSRRPDLWRWIGFLLLLIILIVFYLSSRNQPAPAPLPNAAGVAFWERLNGLQKNEKVLVILDYQPATADEMEANFLPVLARLKEKGNPLRFVALWPDGLWLGKDLAKKAGFSQDFRVDYLPGGTLGMLSSAAGLQVGEPDSPLISNTLAMRSYAAVLYAGDNPQSAKAWIEQVNTSLLPGLSLVLSTQAAQVMLMPYYDSGQIAGLQSSPYQADGKLLRNALPDGATPAFEAGMGVMAAFLALGFLGKLIRLGHENERRDGKA